MKSRLATLCAFALAGCAPAPLTGGTALKPVVVDSARPVASGGVPEADPVAPRTKPVVLVTDPAALAEIARSTGNLAALIEGASTQGGSNADLARGPEYSRIVRVVRADMDGLVRGDPLAGISVARNSHRAFDVRWLTSARAHFELVGVANRIDRRPFHASACGETRLVFRLAYSTEVGRTQVSSRLPVTLIAELTGIEPDADGSCRSAANSWLAPATLEGAELGRWLARDGGPLAATRIARERVVQLGVNFQAVRWPSTIRPDLGGHAEYILRGFEFTDGHWHERPLENTPDVARLGRDPALRRELIEWISLPDHLSGLDGATLEIPRKFLATRAVSVTPRGFGRRANRPFRQIFEAREFAKVDFTQLSFAHSPEALLRRLDELSCPGCHQSRSLAGFHLLGEDGVGATAGNEIATPISPHLTADLVRRTAVLEHLAAGESVSFAQPPAERGAGSSGYGAHCGLGGLGFSEWKCDAGLACRPLDLPPGDTSTVGVCLPDAGGVGDPCEAGSITQTADPHRDRLQSSTAPQCSSRAPFCIGSAVGFPAGMCAASCGSLPDHATCGAIAELDPFNACLARGEPFGDCIKNHSNPSGLRTCSLTEPCRDDYLCARTSSGTGVCIPPYFLFQLRIDGHPSP